MITKSIVVPLGDNRNIELLFIKKDAEWICTASDEFMCDLWMYYPHVLKTDQTPLLKVGDRVKVKRNAGFHKGATGEIKYIEPTGNIWVRRDGSSSDVWYKLDELEKVYNNSGF